MCEECRKVENKLSKYRWFLAHGFDRLTEERMKAAIADLERDQKAIACKSVDV
jgi:hypothetical protein